MIYYLRYEKLTKYPKYKRILAMSLLNLYKIINWGKNDLSICVHPFQNTKIFYIFDIWTFELLCFLVGNR